MLTDLKKNGDLGKETILRKSMLDDCKGEKFEELLAVFSTNVLRRVLGGSRAEDQLNPALRLSLAGGVSAEDYSQLALPLLLAHRVSIAQSDERRTRVQGTLDRFSEVLDSKQVQLDQRANERRQSHDLQEPADLDRVTEHVKTHWLGSGQWAHLLLNGGSQSSNDAFLDLPFAQAWATAKESTVDDLQTGASRDLLLDLESRVAHQKDRLNRWRDYDGDTAAERNGQTASSSSGTSGNSVLAFRDHQALTVASISKAVREPGQRTSPTVDHHRALLLAMNESLASIDGKSRSTETESKERAVPDASAAIKPEPDQVPDEVPEEMPETQPAQEPTPSPSPSYHEQIQQASPTVSISEPSPEDQPNLDTDQPQATLAERTRKSLSLLPPRSTAPPRDRDRDRDQEPSRRKSRMSLPVNQFETPKKRMPSRTPTPRDELFEEEADYASVFRSRPRIAQSPVSSPAVHVSPLSDFDLSGVDHDESSELGLDSPSVRR